MPTEIDNPPDPARLIHGLRDTGYDLLSASADIIDNSIAAGAANVNVLIELREDGRRLVYFGDDGTGMSHDGLVNAMRYGSDERAVKKSLGKFGLGLKTASSAICRKFSLVSRDVPGAQLEKVFWDLDRVAETNKWTTFHETPVTEEEGEVFNELCGATGTLVVLEKCDRLLNSNQGPQSSTAEQNAIRRRAKSLGEHCSLIFHKFLNPSETDFPDVNISINGEKLQFWNPFMPEVSDMVMPPELTKLDIEVADGSVVEAHVKVWILPHRDDFPTPELLKRAKITNTRQGLYIHREGRIIQYGGWLNMWGIEPHYPLIRVEFDFDYKLDEAFKVNVKKDTLTLDPGLLDGLKQRLAPFYREARLRYDKKERNRTREQAPDHGSSSRRVIGTGNTTEAAVTSVDPTTQTAVVDNQQGSSIRIKVPIANDVDPAKISVEALESISQGLLWQPCLISASSVNHSTGVQISKEHDFYAKIYSRLVSSGYSVEGVDLLLWALSAAEVNNTNMELQPIWEDIREEVSSNLRKLLRDIDPPADPA